MTSIVPFLFKLTLATVIVLMVRAIRPIVRIRFAPMHSSHIGAFATNTEVYLCEKDAGLHGNRNIDLFYHTFGHSGSSYTNETACNQQLKRMWDRTLHVNSFVRWLDRANRLIPGGNKHKVSWRGHHGHEDINSVVMRFAPHVSFTETEEEFGRNALARLGIPDGASFVCFYSRDSAFLGQMFDDRDWSPLDYRDSSIHSLVPAADEMTRRGYYAVRMGAVIKEPLQSENPMVIDYATFGRTDFLDIYLCAKCHFFFGGEAGLNSVPKLFRRPVIHTNFIPFTLESIPSPLPGSLVVPKKLKWQERDRLLTLHEMMDPKYNFEGGNGEVYEELGIEIIDNSPDEIISAAIEMDERLNRIWSPTKEDERLQEEFQSVLKYFDPGITWNGRLASGFLRQNPQLYDSEG